jgi:hypothetical protein
MTTGPFDRLRRRNPGRRLLLLGALVAGVFLTGTTLAGGAEEYDFPPTSAGVSVTASPATVTTPKGFAPVESKLTATLTANPKDRIPATVSKVRIYLPHGAKLNGSLFDSCNARRLDLRRGENPGFRVCSRESKIGRLNTIGYYAQLREPIRADIYNTQNGKAFLMYFYGDNPVLIRIGVIAKLTKLPLSSDFAYKLEASIPRELQDPVPGTYASFRILTALTGGEKRIKGKRVGYVEAFMCPLGGQVPFRMEYDFLDGQHATANGFVRCTR